MVLDFLPYGSEVFAALIILISVLVGKVVNFIIRRISHHVTKKTKTTLDDILLNAVQRPILVGIVLGGVYFALPFITILAAYTAEITLGFSIIYTLFGLWFAIRVVNAIVEWYATDIASKTKSEKDDQFLPIIKKVVMGVFGFIALLMILGIFGIEITTLVAALGIGGLAVALALQPTLANFFSGAYLVADRPVHIGDFIELDSGERGTVVDIGWRSTKIKVFGDNLLVIPNSQLADSKITNYYYPHKPFMFTVDVGVSYESDLDKVEKVTLHVAKETLKKSAVGKTDFEPFVRFKEFGDSNINFSVYFHVKKYGDKFPLRHEFIKALKRRYDKEGITIEWPVTKLYYGDPDVVRSFKRKR